MRHFYESIQGWFFAQSVYDEAVARASDTEQSHFVEVGAWMGRSTAYMAVGIVNSGKRIRFDAVDTWKGSAGEAALVQTVREHGGSIKEAFLRNLAPAGTAVRAVESDSVIAASTYEDASLDFVFIDANHGYAEVTADVQAWWPKIKPGGTIAGHAYDRAVNEVTRAVDGFFGVVEIVGSSWRVRKLRVALGMAFYNEASWVALHLPALLRAKKIDGVVGLDCASQDDSAAVFRKYTDHVYKYAPKNDWSEQANTLLEHCRLLGFDAMLRLDPDELMFPEHIDDIVDLLRANNPLLVFPRYHFERDRLHYETSTYPDTQLRAFHLHPKLLYTGYTHESLAPAVARLGWTPKLVGHANIYHYARLVDPVTTYMFHNNVVRQKQGKKLLTRDDVPPEGRIYEMRSPFTGPQPLDPHVIGVRAPLE